MSLLLLLVASSSGGLADDASALQGPLSVYEHCISDTARRLSPVVKTSGPQSGVESQQVVDRAVAACGHERDSLKVAAVAAMKSKPEYQERPDLDAQAEAAIQPFEALFKEDARYAALLDFANRK